MNGELFERHIHRKTHTTNPFNVQFLGLGKTHMKQILHEVNIVLVLIYSTSANYSLTKYTIFSFALVE